MSGSAALALLTVPDRGTSLRVQALCVECRDDVKVYACICSGEIVAPGAHKQCREGGDEAIDANNLLQPRGCKWGSQWTAVCVASHNWRSPTGLSQLPTPHLVSHLQHQKP